VKNLTKEGYQLPKRSKILRDRSQHSIKHRSLDETQMKRTEIPSARRKNDRPVKKKDRTGKVKGEPAKSTTTVKLLLKEAIRPATKRLQGKPINREVEEAPKCKTVSQGRMEKGREPSRKVSKVAKLPTERHYPSLPPA